MDLQGVVFPAGPEGDVSLWQRLFYPDLSNASRGLRQTDQLTGQDTHGICFSHNLNRHADISGERNGYWSRWRAARGSSSMKWIAVSIYGFGTHRALSQHITQSWLFDGVTLKAAIF